MTVLRWRDSVIALDGPVASVKSIFKFGPVKIPTYRIVSRTVKPPNFPRITVFFGKLTETLWGRDSAFALDGPFATVQHIFEPGPVETPTDRLVS